MKNYGGNHTQAVRRPCENLIMKEKPTECLPKSRPAKRKISTIYISCVFSEKNSTLFRKTSTYSCTERLPGQGVSEMIIPSYAGKLSGFGNRPEVL